MDTSDTKSSALFSVEPQDDDRSTEFSLFQALRHWPKVSAYCLSLTSAILLWGFGLAMTGNLSSLPEFQKDYGRYHDGEWIIESKWLGAWNAASPLGMMLGSLAGGALQDRLGRRLCLGIGSLCSTVGVAILFASSYSGDACQAVFLVGKLFQGFTIGIVVCTAQTYMSENLPSVLRGPVIAFFPIFFLVGQLTSALIVMAAEDMSGRYSYRICLVSEWPFSAVPLILSLVLPESPVHLIRKGEMDAALKAQRRLDSPKMDSVAKVSRLQALLLHEQKKANGDRSKYIDCFKNTDMRRTMIAVFGAVVPQLFGLPILGDGAYFLQVAGMSSGRSIIFLVVGIVCGLIGNIISLWLLTFVGRRKLILITLAPLILLWLGMGIAGCFSAIAVAWYVGVTTSLVCLIASLGAWPASYVITAEVSALRLRAKTQGIAWAAGGVANLVFSAVTPFIYNADMGNLRSKIGFVWTPLCAMAFAGAWYMVPEMLGRSPLEVDLMFEQKLRTRKFRHWSKDDDLTLTTSVSGRHQSHGSPASSNC